MILNGMLLTHIRQNGRILRKGIIAVMILSSILAGCSADWWVGDGRGDWTLDLCGGYSIDKINSREILVGKENSSDSGRSIVISNYFVTAYQLHEPYICLEGIHTQKITISDEELKDRVLSYYLIDATDGEVIGPFESFDEYADCCNSHELEIKNEWLKVNK